MTLAWTAILAAGVLQDPAPQEPAPQPAPARYRPSTEPLAIRSDVHEWEVTLPAGYSIEKNEAELVLYMTKLGDADWEWMRSGIMTLPGPIEQDAIPGDPMEAIRRHAADLPSDVRVDIKKHSWRSFELHGAEYTLVDPDNTLEIFGATVIVPLTPRAIQINVAAAKLHESRVRAELDFLLSSVKGTTNWVTAEDVETLQYLPLPGYAGVALAALYLPVWAIFYRPNPWLHHRFRIVWLLLVGAGFFSSFMLGVTFDELIDRVGKGAPLITTPLICVPAMLTYISLGLRRIYIYNEG